MINYKNSIQINPKHHYINVNFELFKSMLINPDSSVVDYGSICLFERSNNVFTVDKIGRITIYYDDITNVEIATIVNNVDTAFLDQHIEMKYSSDYYIH